MTRVIDSNHRCKNKIFCGQPGCLLKKPQTDTEYLANVLAVAIAGESLKDWVDDSERNGMTDQCVHCTLRVLEGKKTYPTEAEWSRIIELGRWHDRRVRRWERINANHGRLGA
jgi:hypothetical protein